MLLAVDTSTAQVGIALLDEGQLVAESMWNSRVHHSIELAPAVAQLLDRAGAKPADLGALAVAVGPGSVTALRVGLAFVKGLALACKVPLVGVGTLEILAAAQPASALPLAAVLQAGRGRVAAGWYNYIPGMTGPGSAAADALDGGWQATGPAAVTTIDEMAKSITKTAIVAGELSTEERQRLSRKRARIVLAPFHLCIRRPSVLAEIGQRRLGAGTVEDPATLAPVYLHSGEPIPA